MLAFNKNILPLFSPENGGSEWGAVPLVFRRKNQPNGLFSGRKFLSFLVKLQKFFEINIKLQKFFEVLMLLLLNFPLFFTYLSDINNNNNKGTSKIFLTYPQPLWITHFFPFRRCFYVDRS